MFAKGFSKLRHGLIKLGLRHHDDSAAKLSDSILQTAQFHSGFFPQRCRTQNATSTTMPSIQCTP